MPDYWSAKDERQYEAILESCKARRRGRGKTKTCKRIAAATVNKQRSREGRTLSGLGSVKGLKVGDCVVRVDRGKVLTFDNPEDPEYVHKAFWGKPIEGEVIGFEGKWVFVWHDNDRLLGEKWTRTSRYLASEIKKLPKCRKVKGLRGLGQAARPWHERDDGSDVDDDYYGGHDALTADELRWDQPSPYRAPRRSSSSVVAGVLIVGTLPGLWLLGWRVYGR